MDELDASNNLPVRHSFRLRREESEELLREAEQYGYQLSSYIRLKLFGRIKGLRLARRPTVEMNMLGDALGKLMLVCGELNKNGSNMNQIAKRLNQGSRDVFGLDGCLRSYQRILKELRQIANQIAASIEGKPPNDLIEDDLEGEGL